MTVGAGAVLGERHALLLGVTAFATRSQRFGSMRQPAVAIVTGLVPRIMSNLRNALRVAVSAHLGLAELDGEVVSLVALGARRPGVASVIATRELVTAAASARNTGMRGARVRVVAVGAASADALGVVGVHAGMAASAGLLGAVLHAMRGVTARALVVRRHASAAEHRLVFVAAATISERLPSCGMRTMAA